MISKAIESSLPDVMQEQSTDSISEPILTNIVTPLTALVSEDARAEIGGVPEEMRGYVEQGLFTPTAGMAQITNKFEGRLFAYIHENEDGKRTVNFIQSYGDGTYSPEFMVSQSDLLTIAMGNQSQDPEMIKDCRKSLKRFRADYLNRCCGKEISNVSDIITTLAEVLSKLPVISDRMEMTQAQLYGEVISILNYFALPGVDLYRRGGYIILDDGDISMVAREMKMDKLKLLEQLKKKRLHYLTGSCRGYQVKVPTSKDKNGKAVFEWCYCLLDMEFFSQRIAKGEGNVDGKLKQPLQNWDE